MANSLVDALNEISDTYAASDPALIGAKELAEQKLDLRKGTAGSSFLAGFLKSAGVGGLAQLGTSQVKSKKEKLNQDYLAAMSGDDDTAKLEKLSQNKELSPLVGALKIQMAERDARINEAKQIAINAHKATLPDAARDMYSDLPNTHIDIGGQASMHQMPQMARDGGGQMDPDYMEALRSTGNPALAAEKVRLKMELQNHGQMNEMDLGKDVRLGEIKNNNEQENKVLDDAYEKGQQANDDSRMLDELEGYHKILKGIGGTTFPAQQALIDLKASYDPEAKKKQAAIAGIGGISIRQLGSIAKDLPLRTGSVEQQVMKNGMNAADPELKRQNIINVGRNLVNWKRDYSNFVTDGAQALGKSKQEARRMAFEYDAKNPLLVPNPKTGEVPVNTWRPNIFEYYGLKKPGSEEGQQGGAPQMGGDQAPSPLDALMAEKQRRMQGGR